MNVFLAGTSSRECLFRENMPKPLFVLESFYYMQEWQLRRMNEWEMFLLDSGAFTYLSGTATEVNWEEYVLKYAEFINKYNIKYFFELDIDNIVGLKEVERLRKLLEQKTNKKCIPVWHKSRGLKKWEEICKEYDYVAIGGIVTKEIKQSEYKFFPKLISIAHKNKCKVHGLGFTRTKELHKYPFDSVDSTNWLVASRFGQVQYFNGTYMDKIQRPPNTKMKHYKQVDDFVFSEWVKFQKYAKYNL